MTETAGGGGEGAAPAHVYPVLAVAVLSISAAASLVRLGAEASPLAMGFWRTAAAALLLAPTLRAVSRRDLGLTAIAGLCLGLHFWSWFTSLHLTTVLRSTLLTCLTPFWIGAMETLILRQPPPRRFWVGIAIAVPGVLLMASSDGGGQASLKGDLLATLAGLLSGAYLFAGSRVRARIGIAPYTSMVCGAAALCLLPAVVATQTQLVGFSLTTWVIIAALMAGPQFLGHGGLNYVLRFLPASTVSAAVLLEPVGAAVIAIAVLGERPGAIDAAGAAVVIAGVIYATRRPT